MCLSNQIADLERLEEFCQAATETIKNDNPD
jgi:hypothetical protein